MRHDIFFWLSPHFERGVFMREFCLDEVTPWGFCIDTLRYVYLTYLTLIPSYLFICTDPAPIAFPFRFSVTLWPESSNV